MHMIHKILVSAGLAVLLLPLGSCSSDSPDRTEPTVLTVLGRDELYDRWDWNLAQEYSRSHGIEIKLIQGPESTTDQYTHTRRMLDQQLPIPDICQVDVAWVGLLADKLLDLEPYAPKEEFSILPEVKRSITIDGKMVAMPFRADTSALYYRSDLMAKYGIGQPPQTWEALEQAAGIIQAGERKAGNPNFWGFVWQGAAYEGLTCCAQEWLLSHGAPLWIEERGIGIRHPRTILALKRAAAWVGNISPPSVTVYMEVDALNQWLAGNAAFLRGWSNTLAVSNSPTSKLRGVVAVAELPADQGPQVSTLGGWHLAISRYSRSPQKAIDLLRYITDRAAQRRRVLEVGFMPTDLNLYQDMELQERVPFLHIFRQTSVKAVARPALKAGAAYAEASRAFFEGVHAVLERRSSAEEAVTRMESELIRITGLPVVSGGQTGTRSLK